MPGAEQTNISDISRRARATHWLGSIIPRHFVESLAGNAAPLALGLLSLILFNSFSVTQWTKFSVPSWDLGIFSQLAQSYANFQGPYVDIKGAHTNLLGDHFHPILVLLGPIWAIWPSGLTLLIVQNVLFAVSVFVVTKVAKKVLSLWFALAIGFAYGLSWGLGNAVQAQFHEIAFGVPLLAFAGAAVLSKRWNGVLVSAGLLVFVKEDLGLTVIVFGIILWFMGQRKRGFLLAAWGITWFFLAIFIIIPALSGQPWGYGKDINGTGWNPNIFMDSRGETFWWTLIVTAFIALRSPIVFAIVPTLLWRFSSAVEFHWGLMYHYSAVLMPILFIAAIDGVQRARSSRFIPERWYARASPILIFLIAIVLFFQPQSQLGEIVKPSFAAPEPRSATFSKAITMIPNGATVWADLKFLAYLTPNRTVYFFIDNASAPDYFVGDSGSTTGTQSAAYWAQTMFPNVKYEQIFSENFVDIVKRVG